MSFNVGDVATLDYDLTVDGTPTNATVTLVVTRPDGTSTAPTVTNDGTGSYTADVVVTQAGTWTYLWTASGAATDTETGTFVVGVGVGLSDLKARLNKSLTVDDAELQQMLDVALAEYAALVGPIGAQTVRYDGTRTIILPRNATVTAVAYPDGTAIPLADLYHNTHSGVLDWTPYRTSTETYMVWDGALRHIDVTFTTTLPAHHREAILADVAGYFAATQRGNSGGALPPGYESGLEDRTTPITLFPRIRALASSFPSVA